MYALDNNVINYHAKKSPGISRPLLIGTKELLHHSVEQFAFFFPILLWEIVRWDLKEKNKIVKIVKTP